MNESVWRCEHGHSSVDHPQCFAKWKEKQDVGNSQKQLTVKKWTSGNWVSCGVAKETAKTIKIEFNLQQLYIFKTELFQLLSGADQITVYKLKKNVP